MKPLRSGCAAATKSDPMAPTVGIWSADTTPAGAFGPVGDGLLSDGEGVSALAIRFPTVWPIMETLTGSAARTSIFLMKDKGFRPLRPSQIRA